MPKTDRNINRKTALLALLTAAALSLNSCASSAEGQPSPSPTPSHARADSVDWPRDKLKAGSDGAPTLRVYVTDADASETMPLETYVAGVLAGEMKNDWPQEALKAQAILARTFVLKFVQEKQSKYEGADISTDIEEAQAYDAGAVNERIREAVTATEGLVLSSGGKLPYAWFHAHSGGTTALAVEGLGWDKDEPGYTQVVKGREPEAASNNKDTQELKAAASWEATFAKDEFEAACKKAGADVSMGDGATLEVAERGESGRAVTISVNGASVSASSLRIALGSTKMRSTLLTSLRMQNGQVHMAGKGYGHGVGMSQWGAYGLAESGAKAEDIVRHYFQNVEVVKIW